MESGGCDAHGGWTGDCDGADGGSGRAEDCGAEHGVGLCGIGGSVRGLVRR